MFMYSTTVNWMMFAASLQVTNSKVVLHAVPLVTQMVVPFVFTVKSSIYDSKSSELQTSGGQGHTQLQLPQKHAAYNLKPFIIGFSLISGQI